MGLYNTDPRVYGRVQEYGALKVGEEVAVATKDEEWLGHVTCIFTKRPNQHADLPDTIIRVKIDGIDTDFNVDDEVWFATLS